EGSGDGGSDGGGPVTASYLSAATREARTLTGSAEGGGAGAGYLLHDRHGNTTALTTTSPDASVTAAWNYNDYGQHTTTNGTPLTTNAGTGAGGERGAAATAGTAAAVNPFTYSGEHTDTRLGTQYLKNRIYDTSQGRFTTRDTAPLHNRYQYADTNPITNTDPTGNTAVNDIVSWVMIGVTFLAAIVTLAVTALATGGLSAAVGTALAGAVLDTASAALETAALATGNNQWDSPLNIAAMTLGGLGLALGAGSAIGAAMGKTATTKTTKTVPTVTEWPRKARKDGTYKIHPAAISDPNLKDWAVSINAGEKPLYHQTTTENAASIKAFGGLDVSKTVRASYGAGGYASRTPMGYGHETVRLKIAAGMKIAKLKANGRAGSETFHPYHTKSDLTSPVTLREKVMPKTFGGTYTRAAHEAAGHELHVWATENGFDGYQIKFNDGKRDFVALHNNVLVLQ
ncbi:RHS repeat-associated core domain-containing protein, partial [Streptomyces sp. NPDC057910]|uniref:RHS repeat-associated core domain-containing protein n=1 Tax=Streptomyces sp. NPDC057910 TaxID=3346278 RepID=UPI0036E2E66E